MQKVVLEQLALLREKVSANGDATDIASRLMEPSRVAAVPDAKWKLYTGARA